MRYSVSGKRSARARMLTWAPSGSDWMCRPTPIASSDSSRLWASRLLTTVKLAARGTLTCLTPETPPDRAVPRGARSDAGMARLSF
ncbi:hypothetical protein ACS04_01220 [Streptomyces roseus]|uniref:Uncharacterized protein n=1 Tax=Streptomyces roseus TaxID=66430 RepID=A0A0J6XZC9_9ACTN|nr:hypothetical protein ACS04_01220 [Streptomyces roseus]